MLIWKKGRKIYILPKINWSSGSTYSSHWNWEKRQKKHILWLNIFYPCQIRSILSSPVSGRRSKMWPKEAFRVSCKTKITDLSSSLKVSCRHVIVPWRPVSTGQGDNPRTHFLWGLWGRPVIILFSPLSSLSMSPLHSTPDQGLFKPLTKAAFLFSQLIHHPIVFLVDCG